MSETLTERVADMKSEEDPQGEANVEEIAHSISVKGDEVFVETLNGGEYRFGSIRTIARKSMEDKIRSFQESKNVSLSSETRKEVENLMFCVKQAWDSEINMFRLDYNVNDNGQISEFFIPFESDLIDNPTVFKVYDEDGDFVAEGIEDEIGSRIAQIETTDLYVNSIPDAGGRVSVYRKVRKDQSELYNEKLNTTTDYEDTNQAFYGWMAGLIAGLSLPFLHTVFGLNFFIFVFAFIIVPELFVKIIPRIVTIPVSIIYSMIHAKRNEGMAEKKIFFETDGVR